MAAVAPAAQGQGTLVVKPSLFPVLTAVGGSVRLNVGLSYPIAITRGTGTTFYAVSTCCAHLGCTVEAYSPALGAMRCGCHGSRYNIDGSLASGPATRGLDRFIATYDGADRVTVRLPGLGFAANDITVVSTASTSLRMKLTFRPSAFTSYQVLHQATLLDAPQAVPFSLSAVGGTPQMSYRNVVYNPNDPTPLTSLYVDALGSTGFYNIALVVTEY